MARKQIICEARTSSVIWITFLRIFTGEAAALKMRANDDAVGEHVVIIIVSIRRKADQLRRA
jgi:hypothetical protein